MKFVILGAGAMGCLYGGKLSEAGYDVVLLDVWKEHVEAINDNGLKIEGIGGNRVIDGIRACTEPLLAGEADIVFVFVKSSHTAEAMESARCLMGQETKILTLQNGLGNVDVLSSLVGQDRIIAGTTAHGATLLGPGRIRHAGQGDTIIGTLNGSNRDSLEELFSCLERAGFATQLSSNVQGVLWDKLVVNVGINALTALTGLTNGALLEYKETEELLENAVAEALDVGKAKGVRFISSDPVEHVKEVCRKTSANLSSMLQDVGNSRKTEIDVINGAIVREGEGLGVITPVNRVLYNLIKVKEMRYGSN